MLLAGNIIDFNPEALAGLGLILSRTVGGVSAAVSKTAAAPIERVKLLIQNQVGNKASIICSHHSPTYCYLSMTFEKI